ncbi:glycosyltransferase [Radiobacillus kanasensis]|uniref:glycosyltransferase family protein n=1 Tax=Radiobacillus kanasensis TaxID=2844358 RepID=UPI001E44EED1|nr:glycosyltransferase [Radiobacillus kanasensis]UFU00043.1 glycosyltransferase [Radiobacillus kanasensis]
MTHVCFIVTEHPFLDARILKKEAKSLLRQGYNVTMIVPRRNGYLFDIDGSLFTDRFLSPTFMYEGVKIITYEQENLSKNLKSLLHNLQSGNHSRFQDSLTQLGIEQEADIYHAHEFLSLYSGVGIKRALKAKGKSCRLIYDSHELEPDPLVTNPRKTVKVKQQMLELMLKETDQLITVSESIKSWHLSLNPALPGEVIYNSPPLGIEHPRKETKSELVVAYEGVMGRNRGNFDKLKKILELASEKIDVKAKIIGGWKKDAKIKQDSALPAHLKDKVSFTGWLAYESIPEVMRDVDIGWIDLNTTNSFNNRFAMPNKFFSYLNNGVPVLVNQCEDMGWFINQYKCGCVVHKPQANAEDYVQALLQLQSNKRNLKEMGKNARKAMKSEYSWEHMERKLLSIYDQLN